MSKKFDKFNYQLVESTHKGYQEVLVTFEYKKQSCHYYSFIQEKPSMKKNQYIEATKNEINEMMKNGELEKRAKRYLGYKVNETVVVTNAKGAKVVQGKEHKPMPAHLPFLLLIIFGAILLVAGGYSLFRSFTLGNWPDYVLTAEEKFKIAVHLYAGIGLAVLGLASLGVGIPLFIKKKHK